MNEANEHLLEKVREIKLEHPAWGYRRVWSYLRFRMNYKVNRKRIYRLMRKYGLLVKRPSKLIANRSPTREKPRTSVPNSVWGMDMTKIMIPSYGWVYLHLTLDWGSKKIVSHNLSLNSKTQDWLDCLLDGVNNQFPNGIKECEVPLSLVTDNGCQPTSKKFKSECNSINVNQVYTSFNNPKGNADTERVIRTIKEDLIWPKEWSSYLELEEALEKWVKNYNEDFPHMSLNYQTPYEYEKNFNSHYVA